jgi:tetratricopeptide (TPR) repeat protein
MGTRNILIIVVIIGIVGLGGYLLGTRSSLDRPYEDRSLISGGPAGGGVQGQQAQGYLASGQPIDHIEVLNDLKRRLKVNPNDFKVLSKLGDTYFELMNFENALRYYKRAVEVNPDDVDTYNDLGLTSHYIGNSADALSYIDTGIKKNPYYQRIWLTRGFIMAYGMGNPDEAIESWEKAVSIAPETPVAKAAADYIAEFKRR